MACGIPIAALEVAGVADLMTDGVEGRIAPDFAGLSRALASLAGDRGLRERMGRAARTRALTFTADRFAREALRFYQELRSKV
jgi:glycosyltransferase involved in cell wall biosynthesis